MVAVTSLAVAVRTIASLTSSTFLNATRPTSTSTTPVGWVISTSTSNFSAPGRHQPSSDAAGRPRLPSGSSSHEREE